MADNGGYVHDYRPPALLPRVDALDQLLFELELRIQSANAAGFYNIASDLGRERARVRERRAPSYNADILSLGTKRLIDDLVAVAVEYSITYFLAEPVTPGRYGDGWTERRMKRIAIATTPGSRLSYASSYASVLQRVALTGPCDETKFRSVRVPEPWAVWTRTSRLSPVAEFKSWAWAKAHAKAVGIPFSDVMIDEAVNVVRVQRHVLRAAGLTPDQIADFVEALYV